MTTSAPPPPAQESTNVRAQKLALQATRTGFKLLSAISPGLAARAAESLFCSTRRHPPSTEERSALQRADPFSIRMGLESVRAWRWGTGPSVLLVHGWEGRGSQLHGFVNSIVDAGFSAVTWDALGHGQSPGRSSSLVQFSDGIWAASRQVGPLQGLLGYSMGGAASALAIHEGLQVKRAVFIASPASLHEYTVEFADLMGLSNRVSSRMIASIEDRFHVRLDDMSIERMNLPGDLPLLLIHDDEDREVLPQTSTRIAQRWPGAQIQRTQGLGHRRILKSSEVQRMATDWLIG
jgi:pimeloyl-ACP methyl ester carboxylesterase